MLRLKTEELEAVSIVSNGKRDLEKEKYWREVISSWQASGLSKAQFCREQGLKLNTLCGWVSVIRGRDAEQPAQLKRSKRNRRLANTANVPKGKQPPIEFVEAKCTDHVRRLEAHPETDRIEISTPDGLVVKLPAALNSALLFAVLQALR